jgi:hypothetical protein
MMDFERPPFDKPAATTSSRESVRESVREPVEPLSASRYGQTEHSRPTSSSSFGGGNGGGHAAMDVSQGQSAPGDLASSEDLFIQLRKRLAEADRQARLYADAQQEIDRLRVELGRVRAQAEAEVAQAEKERNEALDTLGDFKRRIRAVVGND